MTTSQGILSGIMTSIVLLYLYNFFSFLLLILEEKVKPAIPINKKKSILDNYSRQSE